MAFRPDIIAGRAVILVSIQDQLDKELRRMRGTLRRFASSMSELGGDLFRFGAVGTIGAIIPARAFMEFQDQMLFMQVKLQATDKEMVGLEKTVLQLGRTTSFTSTEVARAGTELAKAKFTVQQIKDGLQAVLDLGRGAQIPLTEASKLLVNTLQAFKLPAEEASRVASAFITAARNGTIDVIELKESMKELIGTFRFLRVPLDETLAAITALSFSSIKGTKAGTSLNTMFLNMSRHAKKLNKELGVQSFKNGTFVGLLPFLDQMEKSLNKLTMEQQLSKVTSIFNIRGGRAEAGLFLRGLDNIRETVRDVRMNFDEARISALKLDSALGGFFRRALSAFQNLNIAIGRQGEGPISKMLDFARKAFITLEQLSGSNPGFVQALLLIPPAALVAGAALLTLSFALSKIAMVLAPLISLNALFFSTIFRGVVANVGLAKLLITMKGFRTLAFSSSGVFLFIEALVLFGDKLPVIGSAFRIISRTFRDLIGNVGLLGQSIVPAFGIIMDGFNDPNIERGMRRMKMGVQELTAIIKEGLSKAWEDFWRDIEPISSRISAIFSGIVGVVKELGTAINRIISSIASLFNLSGGDNFLGDLFSVGNIEALFTRIGEVFKETADRVLILVEALQRATTRINHLLSLIPDGILPKLHKDVAINTGPQGSERALSTMGLAEFPTEMEELAKKAKKLREELADNSRVWDAGAAAIARAKKLYNDYFRLRGQDLPPELEESLKQTGAIIAASLVGSFEGTRGAKLKLIESKEDEMIKQLEIIAENTADGAEF